MHTDYEVGRVLAKLDALDDSGQTDNALVDNGASMEGMLSGSFAGIAGEEGVKEDPSFVPHTFVLPDSLRWLAAPPAYCWLRKLAMRSSI